MSNALKNQASPYLNELADQPVHWQPWGKPAFEQARKEDKPVLVSIGYSSCHWCKQMSRENYADPYIASLMNRCFICIKVDREERPDLDLLYMEASRMFNQSAGWPLHAFCLPDGSPFWCGTYFPKNDNGQGLAPWPQVLLRIAEHYSHKKDELKENGKNALANLSHSNHSQISDPREWRNELILEAAESLIKSHDNEEGGFSPAPKFPSPMKMDFLFALGESQIARNNPQFADKIISCLKKTLHSIGNKGLFDHVRGGFFRYCQDREWQIPHFEKMLSDNALMISTFSRSWRRFRNIEDRRVMEKTLQWIDIEMGNTEDGFACSLSAESNDTEGAYYLWTTDELHKTLGKADTALVQSNWRNIPLNSGFAYLPQKIDDLSIPRDKNSAILQKLAQGKRDSDKPQIDPKRSCAQHALLVRAWVDAGIALKNPSLIERAHKLLSWMDRAFRLPDGNVSSLHYPDHSQSAFGFLEDYVLWTEAILTFGAISEVWGLGKLESWVKKAETLLDLTVEKFKDTTLPGFFTCPNDLLDPGPTRKKSWYDHAMPSGNSSLLRCFNLLSEIGNKTEQWKSEYEEALGGYPKIAQVAPDGIGHALSALTEAAIGLIQISAPITTLKAIVDEMECLPYRPIFFKQQPQVEIKINQLPVQINQTTPQAMIEKIWEQ